MCKSDPENIETELRDDEGVIAYTVRKALYIRSLKK